MLNKQRIAMLGAEFLGASILAMVALVMTNTTSVTYFIATSVGVAWGLVYLMFGSISGGHANPAVTFGLWTARKINTLRAVGYIAAQMLGGLAAWKLYEYLTDKSVPAQTVDFSTPIWLAEVIGTFILTLGIAAALSRKLDNLQTAAVFGTAVFIGMLVAATASAGLLNPALALGLHSWASVYVFGPLVGAVLGVNFYTMLFAGESRTRSRK